MFESDISYRGFCAWILNIFKCFNAALLAGLISQQSRGGASLDQNGAMPCSNTADGQCHGIMGMKSGMRHSLIHSL